MPWRERNGGPRRRGGSVAGRSVGVAVALVVLCGCPDAADDDALSTSTVSPTVAPTTTFVPTPTSVPISSTTYKPATDPGFPPTVAPTTTLVPTPTSAPLTSTTVQPPAPPGTGPDDEIAACEARVEAAGLRVAFVPEAEMTVGTATEVGASVALGGTPNAPPPGAGSSPTTLVTYDEGRCQLSAQVSGIGFDVDPLGSAEKSFVDDDSLVWSWSVTPRTSGDLQLRLTIAPIVLSSQYGAMRGNEQPFVAAISVAAAPDERSWWKKVNDAVDLPVFNILLVTILGAVVAILLEARRRSRS